MEKDDERDDSEQESDMSESLLVLFLSSDISSCTALAAFCASDSVISDACDDDVTDMFSSSSISSSSLTLLANSSATSVTDLMSRSVLGPSVLASSIGCC